MSEVGRPFPLVIAAPSGAGKTSLANALVERHDDVIFSISATTRPRRARERAGKDYHFVSDQEFDRMIAAGEFLEWAVVHGRRYGTPRGGVQDALERGHIVVLDIDVQGARQVRRAFTDAVLVFVLPPSAGELVRRLTGRGSEPDEEVSNRLRVARQELPAAAEFDYVIVNDDFERAVQALEAIVLAERHRVRRAECLAGTLEALDVELEGILARRR